MFDPLILRGSLRWDLLDSSGTVVTGWDVTEQVTAFKFTGSRDTIEIPATFGRRKSVAGGDDTYTVEVSYLQDTDAVALSVVLWDALESDPGTCRLSGTLRAGAASPTNPKYEADVLVTGSDLGGGVNTVGVSTFTFPCLDRPTRVTA